MIQFLSFSSSLVALVGKLNLQAALLAVIVGVACLTGRRWLTPKWRSILWMLVFVRLVIPFGPSSRFSLANILSVQFAARAADVTTESMAQHNFETRPVTPELPLETGPQSLDPGIDLAPEHVRTKTATASSRWSVRDAGTVIWILVAAFLLGRLGWLRIQLARQLARLEGICHPELMQLVESAACEAKLSHVPRVLSGAPGFSPAVCGWWFPVLILPKDSTTFQPSQLRAVLLHEFRHIRSADTLLTWLPRLLCAAFWFNPLLWWSSRKWHEERELACDEWVLRHIGLDQKRTYLETLVAIATSSSRAPALVFTASIVSPSTPLERRIVAMKRFRAQTWTGMIAGSLLTLVAAAIGLTDAIQAQDERVAEQRSEHVATVDADGNAGEAVDDPQKTAQVPPPAQTLKPKIFFAQHVILWNGTEILTSDQLQERLKKLRATQPVKPFVYHSLGFTWKHRQGAASEADADELVNKAMRESLELIGSDQWSLLSFLSRRGSGVVDLIRSEDDLKLDSAKSLKGRVVLLVDALKNFGIGPGRTIIEAIPAEGAQVVILPLGEPADVHLRNGKLSEPQDEIWYATNADGTFQADPASLPFDPKLLYGDGKYLAVILHESGYRVINGQLAASDATYELLPWQDVTIDTRNLKEHERVEFWVTPEGAHEKFPGLAIGTFSHSDKSVTVKMPRAKGRVAYFSVVDGQWNDTEFRHPIEITADGPKEVTLPPVP